MEISFKHTQNTPIIHVNITTSKYMPKAAWTVYVSNIGVLINIYVTKLIR